MPIPYLPIALAGLIGATFFLKKKNVGMTPERQTVYLNALHKERDPVKLRKLADTFKKEGLSKEADMLLKRAILRELPPEVKQARREAFKKAISSTDPVAVMRMADAYEKEGAIGAADKLREYARGLQK